MKKADEAQVRSELVRKAAMSHEKLSEEKIEQDATER